MRRVLLIISGGVAAYKAPETVRRLREAGCAVRVILTKAGEKFVTPMTLQAVSGDQVYGDLFSLTDESRMGHIELSRSADLVLAAPASADLTAKMAAGLADDLAATVLLASDKPVMIAPAMNVRMWEHPATRANIAALKARGVLMTGPAEGEMACGEYGMGRMAEPEEIVSVVLAALDRAPAAAPAGALAGRRALVTSGPTHEPIDPVRYIANRSSGKQGHAVAAALAAAGAQTTLISGPVALADPPGVKTVRVATAREMLAACEAALPADVCVCAAAVADWRAETAAAVKIKKSAGAPPPPLRLAENPDILRILARRSNMRPRLVVGFAAETGDAARNAEAKRAAKGCDWIAANDVSEGSNVFGGDENTLRLVTADGVEDWPRMSKHAAAARLTARIAGFFEAAA